MNAKAAQIASAIRTLQTSQVKLDELKAILHAMAGFVSEYADSNDDLAGLDVVSEHADNAACAMDDVALPSDQELAERAYNDRTCAKAHARMEAFA